MSSPSVKTCAACMKAIEGRYLLKAVDKFWHTTCLKCCECGVVLEQVGKSCFVKGTAILCRYDYMRMYGSTRQCTRCGEQIAAFDAVYRVHQKVYHVTCFTCTTCKRPLKTGDKYYSRGDGIYCEHDGQATKGDFTS